VKPAHDPFLASRRHAQAAEIFARAAATHESSARRLRRTGHGAAAARVEATAALARERIGQPAALERLDAAARELRRAEGLDELLDRAVCGAIGLVGADFGNLQLVDAETHVLRMAAHRGFGAAFLAEFDVVDDAGTACGRAATRGHQAVIDDVREDAGFAPHLPAADAAGFRAVQSTPLVDGAGRLRGVLSTHFRHPHTATPHELRLAAAHARLVADEIARLDA
jgi:GAF domain-containing protein